MDPSVLADEQAALRRVAELVARQPSPAEVFAAVTEEVGRLLDADLAAMHMYTGDGMATTVGAWSRGDAIVPVGTRLSLDGDSVVADVFRAASATRIDSYLAAEGSTAEVARGLGLSSTIGAPVVIDGQLWGALVVATRQQQHFPAESEAQISEFAPLVATAVSNAEARREVERLASEQRALRRTATLVASGTAPADAFAVVAELTSELFDVPFVRLARCDANSTARIVAAVPNGADLGRTWTVLDDADDVAPAVLRIGPISEAATRLGIESLVAAAMLVDGRPWGVLAIGAAPGGPPLAVDTHERLSGFADTVTTTLLHSEVRGDLRRLAEEQAALRRVATLIARGADAPDLFGAVAREVALVTGVPTVTMTQYNDDGTFTIVASANNRGFPVGTRWPLQGPSVAQMVYDTGRAARIDDYTTLGGSVAETMQDWEMQASVGAPIVVAGKVWGHLAVVAAHREDYPADVDARLAGFAELVSTAIADRDARDRLHRLVEEQGALRRVATLVAEGAAGSGVFAAVVDEISRLLGIPAVSVARFDDDGNATIVASISSPHFPLGSSWPLDGPSVMMRIRETGRPARVDDYTALDGITAAAIRRSEPQIFSGAGVPVVVDARLWGAILLHTTQPEPLPPDTEDRLARFTELIAASVSNSTMRADLIASRARVVAAADESRRRIERNLHDGIQQGLVTLALRARTAAQTGQSAEAAAAALSRIADDLASAVDDLREISRGIHPAVLSEAGLAAALKALARRSPLPVDLELDVDGRFDPQLEAGVYYVVSEALTNAVKHAQADGVRVQVGLRDEGVDVLIRDDGVGGATPDQGSGIIGLKDRVEALGGMISVESPAGSGTTLVVRLPLEPPLARLLPADFASAQLRGTPGGSRSVGDR